jgi:hypothetical protein
VRRAEIALLRMLLVVLVLPAAGCSGAARRAESFQRIEAEVDAICKCPDVACVDRESKDWWDLPWPDLRGADRETHDRSVELSRRGSRCQLGKYAQAEIELFGAWAARTCACTERACADAVDDEIVAWIKKEEHEPSRGPILSYARDAVLQHDRCYGKLAGTPAAPAPAPATPAPAPATYAEDVVGRIAAAAGLVCGCVTMVCADLVDHELVEEIRARYYRVESDPTMGMVLSSHAKAPYARFEQCHVDKSAKWPHMSRLRGNYGIEP